MEPTTIVGIDIGTTKICTLVAEVNTYQEFRIIGVGIVPSKGIRKGVVININDATAAIAESLHLAEESSGYQIASAYVGLAGAHINALNSRGVVTINNGHYNIRPGDINRVLESAKAVNLPDNREILHVIPRSFTVDGDDGVQDPVGMYAQRLEVEAHIITGATSSINNLVKCLEANQIEIDALVLEPLASGEAVLTDIEREMGVVLADIGGGTTDIAIFIEGSIWHTVVLPTGGQQLTNDLAVGLRTPFDSAEEIKIKYGHAQPNKVALDDRLEVAIFGEDGRQKVERRFVAEIIQARTEETFELIRQEIKRSGYDDLLPAGVVLCGGTASLAGIKEIGREVMNMPIRLGAPQDLRGLIDNLNEPAYATSVGLLKWGKQYQPQMPTKKKQKGSLKLPAWLKAFLPG
jgi:cell division protein FtsA